MMNALASSPVLELMRGVPDPEIPVVSIVDLGIVREASEHEVVITPTYAGCPAMHAIEEAVRATLDAHGYAATLVRTTLSPAWSTDWISAEGRTKLREYGIAPPAHMANITDAAPHAQVIHFMPRRAHDASPPCPHCGSAHVEVLSQFGSTACKALYRCLDCREPFDYFKPY
jgi:ring-1,2-phenylacetyl-CoA epoxidase subunit PaaD